MRRQAILTGIVLAMVMGCDNVDPLRLENRDADYFPLRVGNYSIYDVDSTAILFQVETNFKFQLKHTFTDSFRSSAGGYTYIVSRFKRANETEPWAPVPTWQARMDDREGVLIEGNLPFIKMVFPIQHGVAWNGNAQNALKGQESCGDNVRFDCDRYELLTSVGPVAVPSGLTFTDVVKVVEQDSPDLISIHDVRYSVYARGVGLIDREQVYLKYCSDSDLGCLGKQQIDEGIRFKMTLRDHGHE